MNTEARGSVRCLRLITAMRCYAAMLRCVREQKRDARGVMQKMRRDVREARVRYAPRRDVAVYAAANMPWGRWARVLL